MVDIKTNRYTGIVNREIDLNQQDKVKRLPKRIRNVQEAQEVVDIAGNMDEELFNGF